MTIRGSSRFLLLSLTGLLDLAVQLQFFIGPGCHAPCDRHQIRRQLFAIKPLEARTGVDHFPDISREDASPVGLIFLLPPSVEKRLQFPAAILHRKLDLLANLVVIGDGLFALAGERHPHAGHVHEDRQRPLREIAARLRQAVPPPVDLDDALVDAAGGCLIQKRHTIVKPAGGR